MTRRALGTLSVLLAVLVAALWIRARPETPEVEVRPVALAAPTTTTEPPTTTTAPPPPVERPSRARVPAAPRAPLPPAEPALTGPFWVAAAVGSPINVYRSPNGELQEQLPAHNEARTTTIMLVKHRFDDGWLEAYMPTRPNEHTGFIRGSDVSLSTVDTQIKVELNYHRLTAWAGDRMVAQYPVVIGKASTPTPRGLYYLAMLLRTPNPGGAYGPYVFGLSAHSTVYESFGGGDGMVGVHGTNQPGLMGRSASNGCIRLTNAAITSLISSMPVGTPIAIV